MLCSGLLTLGSGKRKGAAAHVQRLKRKQRRWDQSLTFLAVKRDGKGSCLFSKKWGKVKCGPHVPSSIEVEMASSYRRIFFNVYKRRASRELQLVCDSTLVDRLCTPASNI